jgi:5-formyltetrahydrofolate cyclo-ligase
MWYAGVKDELATLPYALTGNETKIVGMPFCDGDSLEVYHVLDQDELMPSRWGLREPCDQVRADRSRYLGPEAFDVVVVPGLAFSVDGERLGSGRGYYDRFLPHTRADCLWIGLCFDEQVVPVTGSLPTEPHDLAMNCVVTPSTVLDRRA